MRQFVAALLSATMFSGAALAASETFPVTFSAPAGVANSMTISDASGSGETNYPLQFGRPFVEGAIPHAPQILVNGAAVPSQADVKNRYPDGSVKFAVMAAVLPSVPAGGSVTLSFADNATPNNTPLTVAQMQAPAYNFDAHENLTIPPRIAGKPTALTACASWASITNGEFVVNGVTVGPINFSNVSTPCTNEGNPGAFPVIAADVNAALPAGMFLTQSLDGGARYFQLTGTAGTSSLSFLTSPAAGTDISTDLNLTSAGALDSNLSASAPSASAAAMLAAAGSCSAYTSAPALCKLWTSGPVAQTILLGDDSAAAAYDIGNGDGAKPFRPRFEATFWPALNKVFVRAIGENDNIAQIEDLDYGVKITLGATSPTNLYTADLSGTGEIYGEGITGLSINQTVGWQFQGAVAIAGTPSSPLVANQIYSAIDPKTDEWFAFKYLSPTSILVQARGEMADGGFGNSANALTGGDPIVITSPTVHWAQTAWTRTGWIGGAPPVAVNVDPNLAYLDYTSFIPNYDPNLTISTENIAGTVQGLWAQYPNNFFDGTWDDGSEIFSYMENPGARPDIGPESAWVAFALESHGDYRAMQMMNGLADEYAEETFNLRESVPGKRLLRSDPPGTSTGLGHAVSIADRKTFNSGFYNGTPADNPVVTGIVDTSLPISTSGASHQPDPYFVPYLLGGDPFYLSQMYFWNSWNAASYRSGAPTGDYATLFFGASAGERTIAWALRGRAETAFIAPDVDAEKTMFTYETNDAIAVFEGGLGITTDANYNTTPPYTAGVTAGDPMVSGGGPNDGKVPPLGGWSNLGCNPDDGSGNCGGEGVGYTAQGFTSQVGSFDTNFMMFYLIYELGRTQQLGFAIGPVFAHTGPFLIGEINDTNAPWMIANEWVPVEPSMPPITGFLPTWAAVDATFVSGYLAPGGPLEAAFDTGRMNFTEGYAANASAAASVLTSLPGGQTAWNWAQLNIQSVMPWGNVVQNTGISYMNADPSWDILPPTGQTLPAQPTAIPASTSPQ